MANEEHLAIFRQGVGVWNAWRSDYPTILPDLSGLILAYGDFSEINLAHTYLSEVSMYDASLSGADLSYTVLTYTDINTTTFSGAILRGTSLMRANLRYATFTAATISGADFSGAALGGTDFTRARLDSSIFCETDLSRVFGLDAVMHEGPSSIGIDTIYKSGGNIPEAFLRGCGLTDWEIESAKLYNPDLSNDEINDIQYRIFHLRAKQALQINPLFISYSHSDGSFVDRIEPHLNKRGIRFWRDIHHATAGKLERQIDQAIRLHPVVLLVLSANSVESDWVQHEARLARKLEKETKSDVLCPIALDNAWKTCEWPERLREQIMEYNVLDFSQWQDQAAFDRMFARLIEGLGIFYK